MMPKAGKDENINFRVDPALKSAIAREAALAGEPVAEFIRENMAKVIRERQRARWAAAAGEAGKRLSEYEKLNPESDSASVQDEIDQGAEEDGLWG